MQLLGQLWQQSPLTMLMVAGLVTFGVYAVVGYVRARPLDDQLPADHARDTVRFDTIPRGWHDGTGGFA
jgi:hypothetical protein